MVDTTVKVRLDTSQAMAQLRKLNEAAAGIGGGDGKGGKGSRFGLRSLGLGAVGGAIGAGTVGALKGSLLGGLGDVMGTTFGPLISSLTNRGFGGQNLTSQAHGTAFGNLPFHLMGMRGTSDIPGVFDAFKHDRFIELQRLTGRALAGLDPRFMTGAGETTKDFGGGFFDTLFGRPSKSPEKQAAETRQELIENLRKGR